MKVWSPFITEHPGDRSTGAGHITATPSLTSAMHSGCFSAGLAFVVRSFLHTFFWIFPDPLLVPAFSFFHFVHFLFFCFAFTLSIYFLSLFPFSFFPLVHSSFFYIYTFIHCLFFTFPFFNSVLIFSSLFCFITSFILCLFCSVFNI